MQKGVQQRRRATPFHRDVERDRGSRFCSTFLFDVSCWTTFL
jgi:hypothetical protein